MHELVKNEKKESRARPLRRPQQQQKPRTGPTATTSSSSESLLSVEEKQQKRIAARAATAMAQVLQRRREPRSLLMWGDRKKAVIKSYPDGSQEIIVPQTLTPEQEHYEFPPRSRFLKKLATSTAERRRFSVGVQPEHQQQEEPVVIDATMKPDQFALQEWFSRKDTNTRLNKSDRAVIDWMNDVERSSKTLLTKAVKPSPTCSTTNKIQFKSDAGKRWANSITANTSLLPPDDKCRKHYVPRRLLLSKTNKVTMATTTAESPTNLQDVIIADAASKIQTMWKEYQATKRHPNIENQIGMTAMASTGQRTPIAGIVHILQMIQQSNKLREQQHLLRMEQLESILREETTRRESAEETLRRYNSNDQLLEKERLYQNLLVKVAELEATLKREVQSRKELQSELLQVKSRKSSIITTTRSSRTPPSSNNSSNNKRKASTTATATLSSNRKLPIKPSPLSPNTSNTKRTRSTTRTSSLANAGVSRTSSLANAGVSRTSSLANAGVSRTTRIVNKK
ncbi:unnamed protein product [Mucor hiemalis]